MENITREQLFKRQTTLAEIGSKGQQKLQEASVVIIGCGGLGTVAATYLAGSGIGRIHLVDFDVIDVSNIHRQLFYTTKDIGKLKVEVLAHYLHNIAPFTEVSTTNTPVSKQNIFEVLEKGDIILDCTDSLPIKYLINDACVMMEKPLVYGSLYKYDGYAGTFNVKTENGFSTNLRDAFPEISKEAIPNCAEAGTLNTIVGIIGLFQANEVLKLVTGVGKCLINALLIYNSLENSQFRMKLKKYFSKKKIEYLFKVETYDDPGCEIQDRCLLISATQLKLATHFEIISVVEDLKTPLPFEVSQKIPFSQFNAAELSIDKDKSYVVVCNRGITSYAVVQQLKTIYPDQTILSLEKGILNY